MPEGVATPATVHPLTRMSQTRGYLSPMLGGCGRSARPDSDSKNCSAIWVSRPKLRRAGPLFRFGMRGLTKAVYSIVIGTASAPQIGAAIRLARESKGMSQGELAQRARVTQATVSRIESGARRGDIETLALIAAGLGLALWILVRRAEALLLLISLPRS